MIGNGSPSFIEGFRDQTRWTGPVYTDPSLAVYRAAELEAQRHERRSIRARSATRGRRCAAARARAARRAISGSRAVRSSSHRRESALAPRFAAGPATTRRAPRSSRRCESCDLVSPGHAVISSSRRCSALRSHHPRRRGRRGHVDVPRLPGREGQGEVRLLAGSAVARQGADVVGAARGHLLGELRVSDRARDDEPSLRARLRRGLSSKEHDYVKDGFWAPKLEDEKKCPDLEIQQLDQITDVTRAGAEGDRRQDRRGVHRGAARGIGGDREAVPDRRRPCAARS